MITQLPNGYEAAKVPGINETFSDYYFIGIDDYLYAKNGQSDIPITNLSGKYSLIGRASELTEDKLKRSLINFLPSTEAEYLKQQPK